MMNLRLAGRKVKKGLIERNLINPVSKTGSRVIMYHSVDTPDIKPLNALTICVDDFEEQIRFFKKKFQILTLEELFCGQADPKYFSIAITFDDGLKNNYTRAFPVLKKYNVPATFFVTALNEPREKYNWVHWFNNAYPFIRKPVVYDNETYLPKEPGLDILKKRLLGLDDCGYREKKKFMKAMWNSMEDRDAFETIMRYWQLMSDEEIMEVAQSDVVTIGSHSYWHNNLSSLSHQHAVKELFDSKKYLEKLTTYPVTSLAYPYGGYTRALVDEAEKMGYKYQMAVKYNYFEDIKDSRLEKRQAIMPSISPRYLSYIISKS